MHSRIGVGHVSPVYLGLAENYLNNYFVNYTRLTHSRIRVELASPAYLVLDRNYLKIILPYINV